MLTFSTNRKDNQESKQDWRRRARSHYDNIAELLKQRGQQGLGVRSSELYASPEKFGRSPRNRISELRSDGWNIGGKAHNTSDWFYFLRSDGAGKQYPTHRFDEPPKAPRPQLVSQPEVKPWNNRPRLTGLPLWDSVVPR